MKASRRRCCVWNVVKVKVRRSRCCGGGFCSTAIEAVVEEGGCRRCWKQVRIEGGGGSRRWRKKKVVRGRYRKEEVVRGKCKKEVEAPRCVAA